MKRILVVLIMLVSISIANAQQREVTQEARRSTPEERAKVRTEVLVKQLNLSEEQKTSVHNVLLEQSKKQQELFAEGREGDREQMRKQRVALTQETDAKLTTLLDNEQKAKYEQIKADRQATGPRGQRPSGGKRPNRGSGGETR